MTDTTANSAAHCTHCTQDVKPVEHAGWRNFWAWITLLQFGAVIAAITNAISDVDPDARGGGIGRLILWPAAVGPAWAGILAAIGALIAALTLTAKAGERAEKRTTCPKCGLRLSA